MSFSPNLDFTLSIPSNATFAVPANLSVKPVSQPQVADTLIMRNQATDGGADFFTSCWNALKGWIKSLWDLLCCRRERPPMTAPTVEDETARRAAQEIWQQKMSMDLNPRGNRPVRFVDLSGGLDTPGSCPALLMDRVPHIGHYRERYPILDRLMTVKLPKRQLAHFPPQIQNELASYLPENLDLYVIIFRDIPAVLEDPTQLGKRNLIYHPSAFPNAQVGETHYRDLSMGVFEPDGVEASHLDISRAVPFNHLGLQNVHIHPRGDVMCVSPDHARFTLPAGRPYSSFYSACKFPGNRAAAFFGVIINSRLNSPEANVFFDSLTRGPVTLQEYKTGIQNSHVDANLKNKIARLLTF